MAKKNKRASKADVQSTELNKMPEVNHTDAEFSEELTQNKKKKKNK
ncbi:hypothetical protein [Paenibacillus sambharensis]|nr:hypothetical protein [Paenibacillus sambharensis]